MSDRSIGNRLTEEYLERIERWKRAAQKLVDAEHEHELAAQAVWEITGTDPRKAKL